MVRLFLCAALCAPLTLTSAFQLITLENVDAILLSKRQAGDPQFDCHANCGYAIRGAREPNYCANATWTAWYEGCMDCAVAAGIWSMYGNSVSNAARGCGLSGAPVGLEGNATAGASASAAASASASAAVSGVASAAASVSAAASLAAVEASSAASSAAAAATQTTSGAMANAMSVLQVAPIVGLVGVLQYIL